ncbi:MAG: DUF3108 domain-containing protein [Saccharospirillum sp.]
MTTLLRTLILSLCCASVATAVTAQSQNPTLDLVPFTAELEAIRYGTIDIRTTGTLSLNESGPDQWHYRLATDGRAISLTEEVWFDVDEHRLLPERYRFDSRVLFVRSSKRLTFDHDQRRVTGTVDRDDIDRRFEPPLYDAIGYQIALQQQLAAGNESIELNVFRHKRPDNMAFRVAGEELLRLPTGQVYTLIIEQLTQLSRNERKLIWVAPDLGYMPIRFGRFEDGNIKEEIRVTRLILDGQAVSFER